MATTAAQRGWGEIGAPGSAIGVAFRKKNIVKITPAGLTLYVNKGAAWLFEQFIEEAHRLGYDFGKIKDDWGYNHRYIAGTKILSNHSWGLAVDLNATTNPMTHDDKVHTDMPAWMIALAAKYGLDWGGYYHGAKKDPMHFEFLGTPEEAQKIIARLSNAGGSSVPQPLQEIDMTARRIPGTGKLPNAREIFMDVSPEGRVSIFNDVTALDGKSDLHKGDIITKGYHAERIIGWEFKTDAKGKFAGYVLYAVDGGTFDFN